MQAFAGAAKAAGPPPGHQSDSACSPHFTLLLPAFRPYCQGIVEGAGRLAVNVGTVALLGLGGLLVGAGLAGLCWILCWRACLLMLGRGLHRGGIARLPYPFPACLFAASQVLQGRISVGALLAGRQSRLCGWAVGSVDCAAERRPSDLEGATQPRLTFLPPYCPQ